VIEVCRGSKETPLHDPVVSCRGGHESYVRLMMLGTKMTGKPRGWGELHLCGLTDCLD